MVACARCIPSGILSALDTIFLIKDAIASGSIVHGGDLVVGVGGQEGLDGNDQTRSGAAIVR